jgi:hypothetical protein
MLAVCFCFVGLLYAYLFYPGTMDWDSARIASMAASNQYEDWFPPAFTFIWKITDSVASNPGTIWLFQLAMTMGGLFLLAFSLLRRGWPKLAAAVGVGSIMPPFVYMFHEMTKDTFMASGLICLSGLSAYLLTIRRNRLLLSSAFPFVMTLAALVLSTRYNSIFALAPLFWLALYAIVERKTVRAVGVVALGLIVLFAAMYTFTRFVLKPDWRPLETTLIALDIAGITKEVGAPVSALADSKEFLDDIARCYTAVAWDSLVRKDCASYNDHVYQKYLTDRTYVLGEWAKAIVKNPIAYARHRIAYFLSLLMFTCEDECSQPGIPLAEATHNTPGAEIRKPVLAIAYEDMARTFFRIVRPWFVFLLVTLIGTWSAYVLFVRGDNDDPAALIVFSLSTSAWLYTAAYLVIGIASEFRYVYWPYQALLFSILVAPSVFPVSTPETK